jgi:hypothetical protein
MKDRRREFPFLNSTRPESHDLLIAGVLLRIVCPRGAGLLIPDRLYRSFTAGAVGNRNVFVLPVRLVVGGFPSMTGLKKKFDTKESWSMFQDARHHWITFHPAERAEPLWVARFDRNVSRVTVYCHAGTSRLRKGRPVLDLPIVYPLDQLLLMYFFARRQGILTHAAGIARGGKAIIFPGSSGAGKSTFSKLLAERRAGIVLSDERMIVREINGAMQAFGTPWAGTAGIARDGSAPLAGIFFLKHGKSNRIREIDAVEAADRLLSMASIPWYDLETAAPIIAFAKRVVAAVPCHEFRFVPDRSAVDFFRRFLKTLSRPV